MSKKDKAKELTVKAGSIVCTGGEARFDIRSSMVAQYVMGASKFALKAREIEDLYS